MNIGITAARREFFALCERVAREHDTVVVDRRGKDKVAMIPLAELERLRALEDQADIDAADAALAEPGERILYDQIKADLGL